MGLMIRDNNLIVYDPANRKIQGFPSAKSVNFNMFTNADNAYWRADKLLKRDSYPLGELQFLTNRKLFKLQPGDLFKFVYSDWGITNMICRVIKITEKELGSEELVVIAVEDIDYISNLITYSEITKPVSQWDPPTDNIGELTSIEIVEPPYVLSGSPYVKMLPLVARSIGTELSYDIYESVDGGITYSNIVTVNTFSPYGRLSQTYTITPDIDKLIGLYVKFEIDQNKIDNVNVADLFTTINLAVLGGVEFITFQTMTLVSGTTYKLLGVCRGFGGTDKVEHSAGASFYFIGDNYRNIISFLDNPAGSTRLYKFVPSSNQAAMNPALVRPITYTYSGFSKTPYTPGGFKANGGANYATYSEEDIVLTWNPRVRGTGAGIGVPDLVTDASPVGEGFYKVDLYAHRADVYNDDFLTDEDGWTADGGTIAGNIDNIASLNNNLRFTCDSLNSVHYITHPNTFVAGSIYSLFFQYYIPSGQSNIDGFRVKQGSTWISSLYSITDSWEIASFVFTSLSNDLTIYALDGGSDTFTDGGGDDVFYIRNMIMLVRTDRETQVGLISTGGITDPTYTFSWTNNQLYNNALAPDLTFSLTNYRVEEEVVYASEPITIFVRSM